MKIKKLLHFIKLACTINDSRENQSDQMMASCFGIEKEVCHLFGIPLLAKSFSLNNQLYQS